MATSNLDTPINRQWYKTNMDARLVVKSNSFLFSITIVAGVYSTELKRYAVPELLSVTRENETPFAL